MGHCPVYSTHLHMLAASRCSHGPCGLRALPLGGRGVLLVVAAARWWRGGTEAGLLVRLPHPRLLLQGRRLLLLLVGLPLLTARCLRVHGRR